MPETPQGVQSHLDYWLYGVTKAAGDLGNARSFLRAIQEATLRKLLEVEHLSFEGGDPIEILRAYNRALDERGLLDADDLAYQRSPEGLKVTVGASCPHRSTCRWLDADSEPLPCFRAIAMSELLRLAGKAAYNPRLVRFGVPCQLTLTTARLEEGEDGN